MCLGTVFVTCDGVDKQVCASITHVDAEEDTLVFTDLLGRRTTIRGSIYEVDLNDSHIYVNGSVIPTEEHQARNGLEAARPTF